MSDASIESEVIRRWREGMSLRKIAAELRISRHLAGRTVREHQRGRAEGTLHPDLPKPPEPRGSILDVHLSFVRDLLARWPSITAWRVHEELRGRGFTGGYTIVKDLVRRLRPKPDRVPVLRFETGKGQQAQMDYAVYEIDFAEEGRRKVNLFSYLLGYSRRQYLRFVLSQDFETTIREHVRAFEHLGGVAATCLYDNMKVVVARYEGDEPIYNTRFLAFATHYGYKVWACRRRRPQTKGKIERPFRYVEGNFLNGRSFRNFEHLNECLAQWLAEVADARVHRETKRRPIDLHAEELPYLIPLPEKPYDTAEVVYRTVNAEGLVAYRQNFYSVPWRHLGQVLPLRITEEELIVYGPGLEIIARHPLLPRWRRRPAKRVARASPPGRHPSARGPLAGTFRRVGTSRQPVPGRPIENPSHGQGPGNPRAGAAGNLPQARPDLGPGTSRAIRGLLVAVYPTHPRGPSPAQDPFGIAGRPTARTLA